MDFRLVFVLVGAAAALAECSPKKPEGEYPISLAEAMARLEKADIIGFRNARQCGYLIHFENNHPTPNAIEWIVVSGKTAVASFKIALSPTEKGAKADIILPKAADGGEIYDGKQAYDYPVFMQPLRPALQELVDAAMDQRPYDFRRLPSPLNIAPAGEFPHDTATNCTAGRDGLEGGQPWSMKDPPGLPPEVAENLRQQRLGAGQRRY
jgi:hypothetical protein